MGQNIESYGARPLDDFSTSIDLQTKAANEIPEATSSNYRGKTSYAPYPMIYMDRAEGAELTDVDGNKYIDFHCGISSVIVGHNPSHQLERVQEQLEAGPYFATTHQAEYEAAKIVNDLVPNSDLTKFINTGTEAVMSALRLARAYTGKDKILKFEGMYHGHTDDMLASVHPHVSNVGSRRNPTKIPSTPGIPGSTLDNVEVVPWNDLALLEERLERQGDDIAALITEAVMSNSGLIWPEDGYLDSLRDLCDRYDVLFILDEVVTGFRMGLGGAQGHFDVEPDLAIYGKALANGYPCAAMTGREEVMRFIKSTPDKATFMGTFSGNPIVVAATKANLKYLSEIGTEGYTDLYEKGERLTAGLREIAADAGHDVFIPEFAGFFCMHFTDGTSDPSTWTDWRDVNSHVDQTKYRKFASTMIGEGIFFPPMPGRINLMHVHTDKHIDAALDAAKVAINDVSQ